MFYNQNHALNLRPFCIQIVFLIFCILGGQDGHARPIVLPDSIVELPKTQQVTYLNEVANQNIESAPLKALHFAEVAETWAADLGEKEQLARAWRNKCGALFYLGLYEDILEICIDGKTTSEGLKDTTGLCYFLYWESAAYSGLADHPRAIAASKSALALQLAADNPTQLGWSYNSVGEALRLKKDFAGALEQFLLADSIFTELDYATGKFTLANNLSLAYQGIGEYEIADSLHEIIWNRWEANEAYPAFFEVSQSAGEIALIRNQVERAETMLAVAAKMAREKGYQGYERKLLNVLAAAYKAGGKYALALETTECGMEIEREITRQQANMHSQWMDIKVESSELKLENELLSAQEHAARRTTMVMVAFVALLLLGAGLMFRNYTRTRQLNALLEGQNLALDELNQEKDSLMQIVAHDLKAPLSNVEGLSSMMRSATELTPMQEQIVMRMEKAVSGGKELIENLLQLSILEEGKRNLKFEDSNLNQLLATTVSGHKGVAEKKSIDVLFSHPLDDAAVKTVPSHYTRLVDNLLSNAIKYSPQGKRVWVELKPAEDGFVTSIRDEGPGISVEDQKKMFRKFQKLTARPTAGESSTGLGLAIVKELAQQLGTSIETRSKLGAGAEFRFFLPADSA